MKISIFAENAKAYHARPSKNNRSSIHEVAIKVVPKIKDVL